MKIFKTITSKLSLVTVTLGLLVSLGCEHELEPSTEAQQTDLSQIIEVNMRLEASIVAPEIDDELRAGGLQLKWLKGVPSFRMSTETGTIEANCVLRPLKAGSKTELDPNRVLYGQLSFKRKNDTAPEINEKGITTGVELISEGKVSLRGNTTLQDGDQWYVMGMVGGRTIEDGKKVKVDGLLIGVEENGQLSGVDSTATTVPFLSQWVKMTVIKGGTELASLEPIQFRFQGLLFTLDLKNDTNYKLRPYQIEVQSTELTSNVTYDLSSSLNIMDERAAVTWTNTGLTDASGRWWVTHLNLYRQGQIEYHLDPKSQAQNGNWIYDKTEPKKNKVTFLFWAHVSNSVPLKRTGFFISSTNLEAKPAWDEKTNGVTGNISLEPNLSSNNNSELEGGVAYKYVLTSDPNIDGIARTGMLDTNSPLTDTKKYTFASDIHMAPGMESLCAKALQRGLSSNLGKFVHLTLSVPERPVMPLETMAQNNMWSYRNNGQSVNFVYFPGQDRNSHTGIDAPYAKGFAEASERNQSYWMLPSLKQWYGLLMRGHNEDNAHNFNDTAYGFVEGVSGDLGEEEIEFADGTTETFYAMYMRPLKTDANSHRVYGLRFFSDSQHSMGTKHTALTRYTHSTYPGTNNIVLTVETAWLGPEYVKLYDGVHKNPQAWLSEIANNDNDSPQSLFRQLRKRFVTRHLLVDPPSGYSHYGVAQQLRFPSEYDKVMVAYFYGPSNLFTAKNRARGIAYKNATLFTGISAFIQRTDRQEQKEVDFTDLHATGLDQSKAYLRPIRRGFVTFPYKL